MSPDRKIEEGMGEKSKGKEKETEKGKGKEKGVETERITEEMVMEGDDEEMDGDQYFTVPHIVHRTPADSGERLVDIWWTMTRQASPVIVH